MSITFKESLLPQDKRPIHWKAQLLDKLGERLAFERTSAQLYDALIAKHRQSPEASDIVPIEMLRKFLAEELRHYRILESMILKLGGDPNTATHSGEVMDAASLGLQKVLSEPRMSFVDGLEAMLMAELAENDGWKLLLLRMQECGLDDATGDFRQAQADEQRHLEWIRAWTQTFSRVH